MVIFCWYLISAPERCVTWLFFVLRVYWHCSMHQINQISQNLYSRSLGVRQPIVCKGVASAIIDQPRCEILPPPQSSKLTLWDSFIQAPQAPQAPQVLPCRAPLESQYCKVLSSVQPLHYIVQALHCIVQALCKDLAALSAFRIWWFHVGAHPHPSGNFNMK